MAVNKNRINDNIKQLEILVSLLKDVVDNDKPLTIVSNEIGLTAQQINQELNIYFSRYFKKITNITEEDLGNLIISKDRPSTRLLKAIFNMQPTDNVAFPDFDEDVFWTIIRERISDKYFEVVSLRSGYKIDRPMTFDQIGQHCNCTRMWARDMYNFALNKLDSSVLYDVFSRNYVDLRNAATKSDEYIHAKDAYLTLVNYLDKVNDIDTLNSYIKKNYPEVSDFDVNQLKTTFSISIDELNLSTRLYNILKKNDKLTLNDIYNTSVAEYRQMTNFGKKCFEDLLAVLIDRSDNHPNRKTLINDLNHILSV